MSKGEVTPRKTEVAAIARLRLQLERLSLQL